MTTSPGNQSCMPEHAKDSIVFSSIAKEILRRHPRGRGLILILGNTMQEATVRLVRGTEHLRILTMMVSSMKLKVKTTIPNKIMPLLMSGNPRTVVPRHPMMTGGDKTVAGTMIGGALRGGALQAGVRPLPRMMPGGSRTLCPCSLTSFWVGICSSMLASTRQSAT